MSSRAYTVSLPDWEGPLDLLLHVIRSHELDILDIPIAFVTEQYLGHIETMRELNLDVAAEYLEMAATLAYIKSRMMLPQQPEDDDAGAEPEADPREELVRRLLAYQRYKDAAEQLGQRPFFGRDTFGPGGEEPIEAEGEEPQLVELGVFDLLEAFRQVLERTSVDLSHEITTERASVSERIGEIVEALRPGVMVPFDELFQGPVRRIDVVVTFLALLEMTKLRMVRLFQTEGGGRIYVTQSSPERRRPVLGRSETDEADPWRRGASVPSRTLPRTLMLLRPRSSRIDRRGRSRKAPVSRARELLRSPSKGPRKLVGAGRSPRPHR